MENSTNQTPSQIAIEISESPISIANPSNIQPAPEITSPENSPNNPNSVEPSSCKDKIKKISKLVSYLIPAILSNAVSTSIYLSKTDDSTRTWSAGTFSGIAYFLGSNLDNFNRGNFTIKNSSLAIIPAFLIGGICAGYSSAINGNHLEETTTQAAINLTSCLFAIASKIGIEKYLKNKSQENPVSPSPNSSFSSNGCIGFLRICPGRSNG